LTVTNIIEMRKSGGVSAKLAGGATLIKTTTGAATVSGANTYTGGTIISEGILYVKNSTGSGTGTGGVTIEGTGMMAGTGTVSGNVVVTSGGKVSPAGSTVGELTYQNGLNMTNSGMLKWHLGALKDNTNGTIGVDFDCVKLTGGQLELNEDSILMVDFTEAASAPKIGVAFWETNHTWTVIRLSGGATNVNDVGFGSVVNLNSEAAVYETGTFSSSASGTNVFLHYTPTEFGPSGIIPPPVQPSIGSIAGAASSGVQINWAAIPGSRYEVQYTTDLSNPTWQVLTEVIAEDAVISVTDFPSDDEPQRFYRLLAK
jgi:autotransporter-associated beta strand protein